ncbi:MAG: hypothetical protein V3V02_10635 [Rhizobiaceae bacterium]
MSTGQIIEVDISASSGGQMLQAERSFNTGVGNDVKTSIFPYGGWFGASHSVGRRHICSLAFIPKNVPDVEHQTRVYELYTFRNHEIRQGVPIDPMNMQCSKSPIERELGASRSCLLAAEKSSKVYATTYIVKAIFNDSWHFSDWEHEPWYFTPWLHLISIAGD